jgi:hypothetical protein
VTGRWTEPGSLRGGFRAAGWAMGIKDAPDQWSVQRRLRVKHARGVRRKHPRAAVRSGAQGAKRWRARQRIELEDESMKW